MLAGIILFLINLVMHTRDIIAGNKCLFIGGSRIYGSGFEKDEDKKNQYSRHVMPSFGHRIPKNADPVSYRVYAAFVNDNHVAFNEGYLLEHN